MSLSRVVPAIEVPPRQSGPPVGEAMDAVLPSRWAFLRSPPANGVTNMAIDAALLDLAAVSACAVWRCYAWEEPTVSFGRNERTHGRYSPSGLRAAGVGVVRRPTGGRALLHAREVTYSVAMPLDERLSWRVGYAAVNGVLLRALQALGVPAELAANDAALAIAPDGPVCFDRPAEGEIMVRGRKLVGSAVWRQGGAYLQHGSILLADDQARLAEASDVPLPPPPPAACLLECAPSQATWDIVVDALAASLGATLDNTRSGGSIGRFDPSAAFSQRVAAQRATLGHDNWLWRR